MDLDLGPEIARFRANAPDGLADPAAGMHAGLSYVLIPFTGPEVGYRPIGLPKGT